MERKGDGAVSGAVATRWRTTAANKQRPPTKDKVNILQVRTSHSGETHGAIQIGRVSGIASRFRSPDTGELVRAVAVSHFQVRAIFFR